MPSRAAAALNGADHRRIGEGMRAGLGERFCGLKAALRSAQLHQSGLILLTAAVMALAGCVTGPLGSDAIVPAPAMAAQAAERAGMTPGDITRAAELYVLKCARCHKFYDPAPYTDPEWRKWMTKMSKKSHLEADEESLLSRYLDAARRATAAQPATNRP